MSDDENRKIHGNAHRFTRLTAKDARLQYNGISDITEDPKTVLPLVYVFGQLEKIASGRR